MLGCSADLEHSLPWEFGVGMEGANSSAHGQLVSSACCLVEPVPQSLLVNPRGGRSSLTKMAALMSKSWY